MKTKVFISRTPSDCEAIRAFLPNHVELVAQSMIETSSIPFDRNIPLTDWIFFSSSNAVRHFFEQKPILANQKIGAIGEATARAIEQHHTVDFTGDSIDITDSAYRFADLIGSANVLFPGAAESLRHIQSALPEEQVIDLPVYTTHEKSAETPICDVYVFSSPSNVRSFFKNAHSQKPSKCIAYGEATRAELLKHQVTNVLIPISLEPHSIANTIIQQLEG